MSVCFSCALAPGRRNRRRASAFTLVEMLVAMAVTLILIGALSQAFAIVGQTVAQGRAAIELSGNLRSVANQLQEDLTGVTVAVRPWTEDRAGEGYLEVVEGPMSASWQDTSTGTWTHFIASSDKDWDGNGIKETRQDADASGVDDVWQDADSNTVADILESDLALATQTHYGDIDDVLAFTTRNAVTPFVGQYTDPTGIQQTAQSPLAEVVWWIQYDDRNENGTREVEEPFIIYRRVMLIVPTIQIGTLPNGVVRSWVGAGNAFAASAAGLANLHAALAEFYNKNDLSVRLRWWVDSNGINVKLIANSLADLTRRENRFAHVPILSDRAPTPQYNLANVAIAQALPYDALPRVVYDARWDRIWMPGAAAPPNNGRFGFPLDVNRRSVTSLYRAPKTLAFGHYGEDVMVSNALAFDVQVFDPTVPIQRGLAGEALVPSDPGYDAFATTVADYTDPTKNWIGNGAFVDLGYGQRLRFVAPGLSTFSGGPEAKSRLALPLANGTPSAVPVYSYCTWSGHYERNGTDDDGNVTTGPDGAWGRAGVDDDGNGNDDDEPEAGTPGSDDLLVDTGTDGFDNDNVNGVDDVGERETSPPYPVPLRGIQVKIRALEPDTRQIRQVTVVSDFIPE